MKSLTEVIISLTLVLLTGIDLICAKTQGEMHLPLAKFALWSCTDHPLNFLFLNTGSEAIVTFSAYGRHRQVQGATSSFHFLSFRTTKTYKWEEKFKLQHNSPSSQNPKMPLTHLLFETEMLQRDVLVPLTVVLGWFLWSVVGFLFNSSLPPTIQDLWPLCHTQQTAGLRNLAEWQLSSLNFPSTVPRKEDSLDSKST